MPKDDWQRIRDRDISSKVRQEVVKSGYKPLIDQSCEDECRTYIDDVITPKRMRRIRSGRSQPAGDGIKGQVATDKKGKRGGARGAKFGPPTVSIAELCNSPIYKVIKECDSHNPTTRANAAFVLGAYFAADARTLHKLNSLAKTDGDLVVTETVRIALLKCKRIQSTKKPVKVRAKKG